MDTIGIRAFGNPVSLQHPPLSPEIALWLIASEVDLEAECSSLHTGESPPYWAFCWGSGQALARWLLDHPQEVAGRRVVDFGSGSGVAGIAAALAGARSVVAVDVDPVAREVVLENARANGVTLEACAETPESWDVLLASDVLYEPHLRERIEAFAARAEDLGARVLVGEPDRPGNPGYRAPILAKCSVTTFPNVDSPTTSARVYRLAGS